MQRRSFLSTLGGAAAAGATLAPALSRAADAASATAVAPAANNQTPAAEMEKNAAGMPVRSLGLTDLKVPLVGFPGMALIHADDPTAFLRQAFDLGVDYLDVAPNYAQTECERRMGIALQGLDRDSYHLACKTRRRDAKGAQEEMENSLRLLKTDHFDVFQLHCLQRPEEDVDKALGSDGAMQPILKAREQGKIRYIGYSAHTTKAGLLAMERFPFDTVMFPINFIEYFTLGFGKSVLEAANAKSKGFLALKPLCRGAWPTNVERTREWWYRPIENNDEIALSLRFTLSQPGVAIGMAPSFPDLTFRAIEVARNFTPITADETERLRKLAGECLSIFRREEEQVAHHAPYGEALYADSPHEACGAPLARKA